MVSKDVVVALDGIGLVKVAQSNLSKEEVEKLLDALSQPVLNAAPAAVPDVEPVEKIRRRVEKNVENEIHQIEEKVERELAAVAQPTDFEAAAREEATAELLEDIVPEITPAPVEASVYTPIFVAPAVVPTENVQDTDDEQVRERTARKRRGRRGTGRGRGAEAETVTEVSEEASTSEVEEVNEPIGIKGSTRLEAQRRRRTEMREENKNAAMWSAPRSSWNAVNRWNVA